MEWDVKRLAASLEVACRDNGFSGKQRRQIVLAAVDNYRQSMREFASLGNLDVWYARADAAELRARVEAQVGQRRRKLLAKGMAKAQSRTSVQELRKLTGMVDGRLRILADPPLIVPLADLLPEQMERSGTETMLQAVDGPEDQHRPC